MPHDDLAFPPLDTPKPIGTGAWIVDAQPISASGMPLPIRMGVMRLASGDLVLYSPTPWSPELGAKLDALGTIRHLVAPNIGHWMFVKEWHDRYPRTTTWAAPGLRRRAQVRKAGLRIDRDLDEAAAPWSAEIETVATPGAGFVEYAFFHRESRSLFMTDLLLSVDKTALPAGKAQVAQMLRITAPEASTPLYLRAALSLRRTRAQAAALKLIALEPERVVFAHGRWFETDGTARLREALAWLLGAEASGVLKDKVVVITGASSGIGRAGALAFARGGAQVVLAARRAEVLEEVAAECRAAGGEALAVPTDVTDPQAVQALAAAADAAFGRIDVWINNAGAGVFGAYQKADIALHRKAVEVNLFGTMHGAWAVLPVFLRQGRGVLINNISLGGWAPTPYAAAYTASKFGLRGFTASLRQEMAEHPDIHVCAVFPAMVDTPGFEHGANVSGRNLDPGPLLYRSEDVAAAFVKLARQPRDEVAVGWPARLSQAAYAAAPAITERSTAAIFRRLLARASPAPKTEGAVLSPIQAGVDTSGGWLARKRLPPAGKVSAGVAAVAGAGLAYLLLSAAGRRLRVS